MYLQFNTKTEAEKANNKISQNMGLTGNCTTDWDIVQETADGKFIIYKPEERFMTGIANFQEIVDLSIFRG
jgi:hypothetical protein